MLSFFDVQNLCIRLKTDRTVANYSSGLQAMIKFRQGFIKIVVRLVLYNHGCLKRSEKGQVIPYTNIAKSDRSMMQVRLKGRTR